MLIHLGRGISVHSETILLLTDLQQGLTEDTQRMLDSLRAVGLVRTLGSRPKTLVLCQERGKSVVYLSCVGLRTLRARSDGGTEQLLRLSRHGAPLAEDS